MQIKVIANQNEIYHKQKLLGQGAFGKAYLVKNKQNDEHLVIKEINLDQMSKTQRDQTIKEAQILRNLNHPNIVSLKEFYITKQNKLKMVMQYAECGDISKAIAIRKKTNQHYDEGQVLDWFTQICLAIKHVHDRKILHRDIKGQNVFITKTNTLKLGDFGIARVLNKTVDKARTVVGTPYYLSPEIIENKPYSFKSDIWSMGVLLYELCAFTQPFTANSLQFLALKIVKGSFIPIQNYSKQLKSLIAEMLSLNPDKRPSVNQILKKTVIQNRIRNFLTDSKHGHEFSHTVLHNQKVQIFANKLVQQQQQKQNSRQLNPVQSQINKVQQERKKLKQQGFKIEEKLIQQKKIAERRRKIQEQKRHEDERRKYEQDKKIKEKERRKADQQRKKWILHQKQKQEQRDYEQRKKSAKIAQMKRKKQQEEYELEKKRQYLMQQKYEYEEDKKKEQDKIKKIKKQIQNQKKTNELNQFARQQYFENLEIRKRAEERARQERDGYSQPQQFSDKIYKAERDHGYPQSRRNSNKNELIDNYHYNSRPSSKDNSRQKKSQQVFLEKRNQFSMMENINQNLQNEYKNPNFKGELGVVQKKQFKRPRTSSREIQPNEKRNNYDKEREKIREDREKFKQNKMKEDHSQQQDIATIRGAKWEKKVSSEKNIQEQEKLPQFKQPYPSSEHSTQFQIQDSCKLLINQKQKQNFNEYLVQLEGILDNINKNIQVAQLPPSQKPKQSPLMQIPIVEEVIFRDDDELNFSLTAENKIQGLQKEQQMMQQQVDLDYFSNFSKLQTLRMQLEEIFGTQKFIQLYRIFQKQMTDKGLQEFDLCQIIENLGEQFDSKLITENMSRVMILIVMEQKMNNI